jgi:hypothetical protein
LRLGVLIRESTESDEMEGRGKRRRVRRGDWEMNAGSSSDLVLYRDLIFREKVIEHEIFYSQF